MAGASTPFTGWSSPSRCRIAVTSPASTTPHQTKNTGHEKTQLNSGIVFRRKRSGSTSGKRKKRKLLAVDSTFPRHFWLTRSRKRSESESATSRLALRSANTNRASSSNPGASSPRSSRRSAWMSPSVV